MDWAMLYYQGVVLLGMEEDAFWQSTLRKICALLDVHMKMNGLGDSTKKEGKEKPTVDGYIDDLPFF